MPGGEQVRGGAAHHQGAGEHVNMSTHVNTCQHVTISTLRLVQSVERVVAQPPVVMPGQPGNHSATVGDSVTLSCQLTVQDVATPHTTAWFK